MLAAGDWRSRSSRHRLVHRDDYVGAVGDTAGVDPAARVLPRSSEIVGTVGDRLRDKGSGGSRRHVYPARDSLRPRTNSTLSRPTWPGIDGARKNPLRLPGRVDIRGSIDWGKRIPGLVFVTNRLYRVHDGSTPNAARRPSLQTARFQGPQGRQSLVALSVGRESFTESKSALLTYPRYFFSGAFTESIIPETVRECCSAPCSRDCPRTSPSVPARVSGTFSIYCSCSMDAH